MILFRKHKLMNKSERRKPQIVHHSDFKAIYMLEIYLLEIVVIFCEALADTDRC